MNEKTLEFKKLCLDIKMYELEQYLNDPKTKAALEIMKVKDPDSYNETMQKVKETKEEYYKLMGKMELVESV